MSGKKNKRVVLTGGGTGGHVYPSLAIYQILKEKEIVDQVLYIGSKGRAEEKIVPKHNLDFTTVRSAPFQDKNPVKLVKNLITLTIGVVQAQAKLLKFKPALVVAAGGYVSAPVVIAAYILRPILKCKIVVNEQNIVPGVMNKLASVLSHIVFTSYRETKYFLWSNRCIFSGYPVRQIAEKISEKDCQLIRKDKGIADDEFVILIVGGSLGAKTINEVMLESLEDFTKMGKKIRLIHSIGMNNSCYNAYESTKELYVKKYGDAIVKNDSIEMELENVKYFGYKFIDKLPEYMQVSDLIISRAGAGSMSEIQSIGKSSILIPKKNLPGNHQELNAIDLAEKNCCDIIFESSVNGEICLKKDDFVETINNLVKNDQRRELYATNAYNNFYKKTAQVISEYTELLLDKKKIGFDENIIVPKFVEFQNQFDHLITYLMNLRNDFKKKYDDDYLVKFNENFYVKFYGKKISEYLSSSDYLVVNKGVKLVGALGETEYTKQFLDIYPKSKGFLKRNIFIAFSRFDTYQPAMEDIIYKGICDKYFEVSREAIKLYRNDKFYSILKEKTDNKLIEDKIIAILNSKKANFEIRVEAMKASVLFLSVDEIFAISTKIGKTRNPKLRRAVLDAFLIAIEKNIIPNDRYQEALVCLNTIPFISPEFKPYFNIKDSYNKVVSELTKED